MAERWIRWARSIPPVVSDRALLVGAFVAGGMVTLAGVLRGRYFEEGIKPGDLPLPFWMLLVGGLIPVGFFVFDLVRTCKKYRSALDETERRKVLLRMDTGFVIIGAQPAGLGVLSTVYGRSVLWPIAGALAAAAAKVIRLRSGVRRSRETPLQRETEDAASGRPAGAGHD